MHKSLTVALIVFAALAATFAPARAADLTGQQIADLVVGNTITGVYQGKKFAEFMDPSHRISARNTDGPYSGRWEVRNERFCLSYAEDFGCFTVVQDQSGNLNWMRGDERVFSSSVVPGNPNGLR